MHFVLLNVSFQYTSHAQLIAIINTFQKIQQCLMILLFFPQYMKDLMTLSSFLFLWDPMDEGVLFKTCLLPTPGVLLQQQ